MPNSIASDLGLIQQVFFIYKKKVVKWSCSNFRGIVMRFGISIFKVNVVDIRRFCL